MKPKGWQEAAGVFSDRNPRSVADSTSPTTLIKVREWKKAAKAAKRDKQDREHLSDRLVRRTTSALLMRSRRLPGAQSACSRCVATWVVADGEVRRTRRAGTRDPRRRGGAG